MEAVETDLQATEEPSDDVFSEPGVDFSSANDNVEGVMEVEQNSKGSQDLHEPSKVDDHDYSSTINETNGVETGDIDNEQDVIIPQDTETEEFKQKIQMQIMHEMEVKQRQEEEKLRKEKKQKEKEKKEEEENRKREEFSETCAGKKLSKGISEGMKKLALHNSKKRKSLRRYILKPPHFPRILNYSLNCALFQKGGSKI